MPENLKIERLGNQANAIADQLKPLANQRRLKLLCLLARGERSAGELAELIGCGQSCTSQHLALLRSSNLVTTRNQGAVVYYSLSNNTRHMLRTLCELMEPNVK